MQLFSSFLRLPLRQQAVALEATAWLTLAYVLVRHIPMRRWRGRLNGSFAEAPDPPGWRRPTRAVGRMVRRVARRLPFDAACLPRAMAMQWMLRRRGVCSRLVFGARRTEPDRPNAYHAWLTVEGEPVMGARQAGAFVPLLGSTPVAAGTTRRRRSASP